MQGLLGWYMVKSGLIDDPKVSPYRLTSHLLMAFLIYSYILWVALGILRRDQHNTQVDNIAALRRFGKIVTGTLVLMIITGGFVAGTRAGFAYNTFPLMGDSMIPGGMFIMQPFYVNFFENIATVQFDHRLIAYVLFFMVPVFWLKLQKSDVSRYTKRVAHLLMLMLGIQIGLGISTLLLHVPVALGAMHQGGALLLLTIAIMMNHALRRQTQPAGVANPARSSGVITT
jgi:cytochrome c oxidase assembly protein subunit 15